LNKKVGQDTQVIPEYKPGLVKTMNALAVILAIILLIVIYVPASIWSEEAAIQKESRWRMKLINEVQRYYKQLTGEYQPDPILAMKIVKAVRDSSRADSLFHGSQIVKLKEGRFKVEVPPNFYYTFDTCFSVKYQKQDTVLDTTYKVLKWNPELMTNDTLYVIPSRLVELKNDPNFKGVLSMEDTIRVSTNIYYRRYYLDTNFAYRPLTNLKYEVEVNQDRLVVRDPLKEVIRKPRLLFFAFVDSTHGYIENDEPSWK
jgi:hypothetical protein